MSLSNFKASKSKAICLPCGHQMRFFIALQGSLFLAAIMGNITCWNAALIKLTELETSPLYDQHLNGTTVDWADKKLPIKDRRIDMTSMQISLLFGASFAGSGLFVICATWIMKRIGTYWTQVILGSITTAAAALTPLATVTNFNLLLVLRLVQGMCQCNPYPVIGSVIHTWARKEEKGVFVALLTGYTQLCAVITTPLASYFAHHYGWPYVFYFQATFCGTFLVLWILNYRNDPKRHPFVSETETSKIIHGKINSVQIIHNENIPAYRVLTKISVWVCCLAAICYIWAAQLTISYLVMYLVWVLKWSITSAGILSAVPLIIQFVLQCCTGLLSDRIKSISEHTKIRLFATLTSVGTGIGLIVLAFISSSRVLSTTIIIVALSFLGFNAGGFPKSAVLISQQKPEVVMGLVQASLTLGLLSGSFIVPGLTSNRNEAEYSRLFLIYGGLLIIANIIFVIFCRAEAETFISSSEISHGNDNVKNNSSFKF